MPTWIRVKDDITGHEYDVNERALRRGMTPIDGYPANSGPGARPRPAKPFVAKDGQPALPAGRMAPAGQPPPGADDGAQFTTSSDPAGPADNIEEQ